MIAHSFPRRPSVRHQGVHGATFTVDCAFFAAEMDDESLVVDIGLATEALADTLAPLRYKNLDDIPEFKGKMTTTEFLCKHIFDQWPATVRAGGLKMAAASRSCASCCTKATWPAAWYEGDI